MKANQRRSRQLKIRPIWSVVADTHSNFFPRLVTRRKIVMSPNTVRTVHTYCTYVLYIRTVHTYCTYVPHIRTVHTCRTYVPYIRAVYCIAVPLRMNWSLQNVHWLWTTIEMCRRGDLAQQGCRYSTESCSLISCHTFIKFIFKNRQMRHLRTFWTTHKFEYWISKVWILLVNY